LFTKAVGHHDRNKPLGKGLDVVGIESARHIRGLGLIPALAQMAVLLDTNVAKREVPAGAEVADAAIAAVVGARERDRQA
jgi:hypothetical protein